MNEWIVARRPAWLSRAMIEDIVAAAVAAGLTVLILGTPPPLLEPLGGLTLAVLVGLAGSLLLRRRRPLLVLWLTVLVAATITVVDAVSPGTLVPLDLEANRVPWIPPAAAFAVYSAMIHARNRRAAGAAVLVLMVLGAHLWAAPDQSPWLIQALLFIGGPALLGLYVAARRRLLRSLLDRAERAEREQYLLAERVLAEERSRVAAEMHDVVTHRVSLMVLQAGALQMSTKDDAVRAGAEQIRAVGGRALAELRDLVGLLHGTTVGTIGARAAEANAVPDLTSLVDESRSVGVAVEFREQGSPATVAPIVARTAHRVVQEALTNVRKHAPGAQIEVDVRYDAAGVRVSVRNSAGTEPADSTLTTAGSGRGLSGLRQRIELINGMLEAGPIGDPARPDGYRVEATLPPFVTTSPVPETAR